MDKKFWFFINRELYYIIKELKDILQLAEYHQDAEDTWEWFESNVNYDDELYFNISREHNDGYGKFDCPLILDITRVHSYKQSEIDNIGRLIAKKLNIEVFWGFIDWQREKENGYIPEYQYYVSNIYRLSNE